VSFVILLTGLKDKVLEEQAKELADREEQHVQSLKKKVQYLQGQLAHAQGVEEGTPVKSDEQKAQEKLDTAKRMQEILQEHDREQEVLKQQLALRKDSLKRKLEIRLAKKRRVSVHEGGLAAAAAAANAAIAERAAQAAEDILPDRRSETAEQLRRKTQLIKWSNNDFGELGFDDAETEMLGGISESESQDEGKI